MSDFVVEEIPIKFCDETDFASFAPGRVGQRSVIDQLKKMPKSMMCLDLVKFEKPITIFGGHDSDKMQWLDLQFAPCNEEDPDCRVKDFRDKETGLMNTDALWNELGSPIIEVLFREERVDVDDPFHPIKTETTMNRSYLKKYLPTWGHNKVQMNKF